MTVPKSLRTESKLQVHVVLRKLVAHTLTKTKNGKKFGGATNYVITRDDRGAVVSIETHRTAARESLAARIENAALAAGECAWRANDIRIDSDYAARKKLQEQCLYNLDALMWLIEIARETCNLSGKETKYWQDLTKQAKGLVRSWKESDAKRV